MALRAGKAVDGQQALLKRHDKGVGLQMQWESRSIKGKQIDVCHGTAEQSQLLLRKNPLSLRVCSSLVCYAAAISPLVAPAEALVPPCQCGVYHVLAITTHRHEAAVGVVLQALQAAATRRSSRSPAANTMQ
jgi:hypothetical protein